jgi:ABC-type multidrug transport system ATPase subunit
MNELKYTKNINSYLFLNDPSCGHSSYLSEFIAFIKSQHSATPVNFSYVGDETNLMPKLTLNQNILMNFSPISLTNEKVKQFEDYLTHNQNAYIKKLYDKLIDRDIVTQNAGPEMKKLTSLIKALITESDYIFLENPENDLSENIRILFNKALETHIQLKNIKTFIYSSTGEESWKPYCMYTVSRNKYFQFHLESIIVDETMEKTAA